MMPSSAKQFIPFIREKFPKLARQYEQWYSRNGYAPEEYRRKVAERVAKIDATISERTMTAFEIVPLVYGEPVTAMTANWRLSETLCYLTHLEATGRVERSAGEAEGEPERWTRA